MATAVGVKSADLQPDGAASDSGRSGVPHRSTGLARGRITRSSQKLWPYTVFLFMVSVAVTFSSSWGAYVADARFEHSWGADVFLSRHANLWDGVRTLGRPTVYFSPVAGTLMAVFRAVGAPPFAAERLLHATYLTVAGIGMLAVMRMLRPRIRAEHVIAAFIYCFNPYTTQFLLPSGLFLHYALIPWFVLVVVRGITSDDRWRWAAGFALLVGTLGAVNSASLLYALMPSMVAAGYYVLVERTARFGDLVRFGARVFLLTLGTAAAALVVLAFEAGVVSVNLVTTELPARVNSSSSWSESLRGLGSWLTYFRAGGVALRPEASAYFTQPAVVAATYALPLVAFLTLWRSRWKQRILFGALAFAALVAMVGVYPVYDPSPLGRAINKANDSVVFFRSLRNGYKAGGGLMMAVSALCAVGIVDAAKFVTARARTRQQGALLRSAIAVVAVVTVGLASFPFWTGSVYSRRDQVTSIPGYWEDAISWLDAQPGQARALILPGVNRARYRWGYVGDDIFDGLLRRPHVERWSLPQGTPEAADLLVAMDNAASSRRYQAGSLLEPARRLGIRWIVIRNDLDWQSMRIPRPSTFQPLRTDPTLRTVKTFGRTGQNVRLESDGSAIREGEDQLPPVEILEVPGVDDPVRATTPSPPLLVSGDGDGVIGLAAQGTLTGAPPVRYTGSSSAGSLTSDLSRGSSLIVTDTNRRRVTKATSTRNQLSETLPLGAAGERPPLDLFMRAGSQTTVDYGKAASIDSSRRGSPLGGTQPWARPSNAFDGVRASSWLVSGNPIGDYVRANFRRPQSVSQVEVVVDSKAPELYRLSSVEVSTDSGSPVLVDVSSGSGRATFPTRKTTSLTIRVAGAAGQQGPLVGISEVSVPGLDLRETATVPSDVAQLATADPALTKALEQAPVAYSFDRLLGSGTYEEEVGLRRRFDTFGDRSYAVKGTARFSVNASDSSVDDLLGDPVGAIGTSRTDGAVDYFGGSAVDDDFETGWDVPAVVGQVLTVRFPTRTVGSVAVVTRPPTQRRPTPAVDVGVAVGAEGRDQVQTTTLQRDCGSTAGVPSGCQTLASVTFEQPTQADHLTIQLNKVQRAGASPGSLGIQEILIDGKPLGRAEPDSRLPATCRPMLTLDGQPLSVRLEGTRAQLLSGEPVPFVGCSPQSLEQGSHLLETSTSAQGLIDHLELESGTPSTTRAAAAAVTVVERHPSEIVVRVRAPDGAHLVNGQAFGKGWRASIAGGPKTPAGRFDTLSGWTVPPTGSGDALVKITYGPQQIYGVAVAVSGGFACLCLWLLVGRRRRAAHVLAPRALDPVEPSARSAALARSAGFRHLNLMVMLVVLGVGGYLIAGVGGAALGLGIALVGSTYPGIIAMSAALGVLATAVVSLVEGDQALAASFSSYVTDRPLAAVSGRLTGVLLLGLVVLAGRFERSSPLRRQRRSPLAEVGRRAALRMRSGWPERLRPAAALAVGASLAGALVGSYAVALVAWCGVLGVGACSVLERRHARMLELGGETARNDEVLRGSSWVMFGFVSQAITGVVFWVLAARLYPAVSVGVATALFSSLQLINYATAMGLQEMLGRYHPEDDQKRDPLLAWSIAITAVTSLIGVLGYFLIFSSSASNALDSFGRIRGFALFTAISIGTAIALLVDARCMSQKRWRQVFIRLTVVGAARIPFLWITPGTDTAVWIFLVMAIPIAISGYVGLLVLMKTTGLRPSLRDRPPNAAECARYAGVNYLSHLAVLAPQFVLPIIVLASVAPTQNANFFLAWSIAAVAFVLPMTISRVLLVESSRRGAQLDKQTRTALLLALGIIIVALVGTLVASPGVEYLYGPSYHDAGRILPLLVLGGLPWAVTTIMLGRARARHDVVASIGIPVLLASTVVVGALWLVPERGLDGAVTAWLLGNLVTAVVAVLLDRRRQPQEADDPSGENTDLAGPISVVAGTHT